MAPPPIPTHEKLAELQKLEIEAKELRSQDLANDSEADKERKKRLHYIKYRKRYLKNSLDNEKHEEHKKADRERKMNNKHSTVRLNFDTISNFYLF